MKQIVFALLCGLLVGAGGCDAPRQADRTEHCGCCTAPQTQGGEQPAAVVPVSEQPEAQPPSPSPLPQTTPRVPSKNESKVDPDRVPPAPEAVVPTAEETIVGKLRGGIVAIGAETTGWAIVPHNEQGNLAAIEVDVATVRLIAEKLEGSEVKAWGVYTIRTGNERGKIRVFVAQRLEAVH